VGTAVSRLSLTEPAVPPDATAGRYDAAGAAARRARRKGAGSNAFTRLTASTSKPAGAILAPRSLIGGA